MHIAVYGHEIFHMILIGFLIIIKTEITLLLYRNILGFVLKLLGWAETNTSKWEIVLWTQELKKLFILPTCVSWLTDFCF